MTFPVTFIAADPGDELPPVQIIGIRNRRQLHRIRKHGGLILSDKESTAIALMVIARSPIDGKFHPYKLQRRRLYIPSLHEKDEINRQIVQSVMDL
jgi:hypothetical protein